jgi:hypothetical protein
MEKRKAYRLLVENPEGKKPLRTSRSRWVDNIRMDLAEVGWGDVDWTDEPSGFMKCWETIEWPDI